MSSTALMYASLEGQFENVKLLLQAGADINAKNKVRLLSSLI